MLGSIGACNDLDFFSCARVCVCVCVCSRLRFSFVYIILIIDVVRPRRSYFNREHKESAKELFLDFLDEPKDSERRVNRDGVYESYVIEGGKGGEESVHIILLDTRWNFEDGSTNGIEADILGDRQWAWFENELMNSNSTITLIGSSIQVLSELNQMYKPIKYKIAREFGKSIENWGAFPSNQKRLLDIVAKSSKRTRAIFLSGDVHVGMIDSRLPGCWMPYETIDATSSGFTHVAVEEVRPKWVTFFYKLMTPSKFMPSWWYPKNVVPPIYMGLNFGEIEIDWTERKLDINILDEDGNIVIKKEVAFTSLEEAKAGNENEKPPTRDECFRERAMTDLQKQLTFHKAALFILFPWILVLVFALFLWYKFVVRLIFCTTLGRSRKKSKRA